MQGILTVDLKLHPYKIKLTQRLKPADHEMRRRFVNWSLQKFQDENPEFSKFVIFSDVAHFQMDGYMNKQNCRYWSDGKPQELQEATQYSEKITVWCGFWWGEVIGPHFFENDKGNAVTVNSERYRSMMENFFWPE